MITKKELSRHLVCRRPDVSSDEDWGQLTVISEYKHLPIEGCRVMDVGGNIGAFAIRAALEGCALVYTYEPEKSNYACLLQNCLPFEVVSSMNYALSNDPSGTKRLLWLTASGTLGSSSLTEFRGRTQQEITTVNFMEQLELWKFTSIKMDCEGEEWELLGKNILPDFVTDVVAELHFTKKAWRQVAYPALLAHMAGQGFTFLKMPKDTGKNFHTLAHWRRI